MPTYCAIASSHCWLPTLGVYQNKSFFTTNNSVLARGPQYSCRFLNACQLKKLFRYNLGWVRGSEGSQDPSPQNSVPNWNWPSNNPFEYPNASQAFVRVHIFSSQSLHVTITRLNKDCLLLDFSISTVPLYLDWMWPKPEKKDPMLL